MKAHSFELRQTDAAPGWPHRASRFWRWLVEPASDVTELNRRREARLFASLLVVAFVLGVVLEAGTVILSYLADPTSAYTGYGNTAAILGCLSAAYALSRTRYYRYGAGLAFLIISAGAFVVGIEELPDVGLFGYLIVPILFASVFLSTRAWLALTAVDLGGLVLVQLLAPGIHGFDVLIGPTMTVGIAAALLLVLSRHRDALERARRAELAAKEAHYRALIEKSSDVIALIGGDGTIQYQSPAVERVLGYPPEELVGQNAFGLLHPDDVEQMGLLFGNLMQAPTSSVTAEFRYRRQDGSHCWVEATGTNLLSDPGVQGIVINYRDVSERKQAEATLRESEEKFRTLFSTMQEGFALHEIICDEAGRPCDYRFLEVNAAFEQLTGLRREHVVGRTVLETLPDVEPHWIETYGRVALTGEPARFEDQVAALDKYFSVYAFSPAPGRFAAIFSDITQGKRAEAALRESEEKFRLLIENALDIVTVLNPDGTIQYQSPSIRRVLGYAPEDLYGRLAFDFIHPDDVGRVMHTLGDALQHPEAVLEVEYRFQHKEGGWRVLQTVGTNLLSHSGIDGVVANSRDITDRKRHEREREAIIAMSAALRSAATPEEMLPIVLDQALRLLDVDDAALVMVEPKTGGTVVKLGRGAWADRAGQWLPAGVGASARVIATGRPFFSNTVPQDPQPRRLGLAKDVAAVAIVPLTAQAQTLGALAAGSRHPIAEDQLRLLAAIADIAANAIQRATLHEQTQRRAEEFAALYETARELAAHQDVPWLLEAIVGRALDLIPATGALIALSDAPRGDLEVTVARGLPVVAGERAALGEGVIGKVAQTWQPLMVDDYQSWSGRSARFAEQGYSAVLAVPMLSGGALIGVLSIGDIGTVERRFSQADMDLLSLLAGQAASAVHNARILEEARLWADQLALLYDAGLALNSVLEPKAQLEYLFKIASQALHADVIEYFKFDATTGALSFELNLGHTEAARASLGDLTPRLVGENSLASAVAHSRLPLNVPDLYADPRYIVVEHDLRSGLWAPVEHQGQLRGVLGVLSRRLKAFTQKDERLLLLFANQTAVAIQNAHLFGETQRRLRHVQALRQVDAAIASSFELRLILNVLLDQARSQLQVDAASVLLLNPHLQTLEYAAGRGFQTRAIERSRLRLGEGPTGRAVLEQQPVAVPDLARAQERLARAELLAREGFAAYFAAPLISKGQVKGVLEVFHCAPVNSDGEWQDFLEVLAGQAAIAVDNVELFNQLQRSNSELILAYDATIEGWSRALDLRDKETEGHTQRVTEMTLRLARALGLRDDVLVHIRRGALLHDIGKMGVPDAILNKPGPLTEAEWTVMRTHPDLAFEMLSPIAFLRPALDIPYCHHEKWDGTGYPRRLKGEQIPQAARIFAVADVWDALRSDRPYRPAWPDEKIQEHLRDQAGQHFDPQVVEAFLRLSDGP